MSMHPPSHPSLLPPLLPVPRSCLPMILQRSRQAKSMRPSSAPMSPHLGPWDS